MKPIVTGATFRPIGMIGKVSAEEEEDEAVGSQEGVPSPETGFDERKRTFEYLKQRRAEKKLKERIECLRQAREETATEVERMLAEDRERSRGIPSSVAEDAGLGISYVEDENGKLVKQRATRLRGSTPRRKPRGNPANDIPYVKNENGELVPYDGHIFVEDKNGNVVACTPPARKFTPEAQERIDRSRDQRHTRAWYNRQWLGIFNGELTVTRAQCQALLAFGRSKGWHRKPGKR